MKIASRPVYFESGGQTLFGWLHFPPDNLRLDLGIVICKPFGYEALCAHGSIRAFADACASTGATVLRFDYSGTGDSGGGDTNEDQIGLWCADIRAATEALRRHAQVTRVGLLGVRFGALLAGLVAAEDPSIALNIAVAPTVSGRRYVRELRAFHVTSSSGAAPPAAAAAEQVTGLEITGFRLSQAAVERLATADLAKLAGRAVADTLILDRVDLPGARPWADALQAQGTQVDYQLRPGLPEMIATPEVAQVPQEMVAAVVAYLTEYSLRVQLPMLSDRAQGGESQRGEWGSELAITTEVGTKLLERPLYVDAGRTLFAISTELQDDAAPGGESHEGVARHGVVMLNGGATSHIGQNRMNVELARRWAARGYRVLRLDLAGLGDSATRQGEKTNEAYPPGALDDVSTAIAYLREQRGVENVTLAGLCAGAYHGLRSAIAGAQVDTVLLVNPLTFYWKQGGKLSDLQDYEVVRNPRIYSEAVFSPRKWLRVFSGRVNLLRVAKIVLARPMFGLVSNVRDLSRWLHIRLPHDLGWELKALSARGVRIVFLFAREDAGRPLLRLQAGSAIKSIGDRCRVHVIDGADHVFSQSSPRRELMQLMTSELPP